MLSLAGAATSTIFVTTKVLSGCHEKGFVGTNTFLSQQKYVCHDKRFATTKMCLSQQTYFYHDKMFVAQNVCRDKRVCCNCCDKSQWHRERIVGEGGGGGKIVNVTVNLGGVGGGAVA